MFVLTAAATAQPSAGDGRPARDAHAPVVRCVRVLTQDVWTPQEIASSGPWLRVARQGMNLLHANTRESVIRRELLVSPGARARPELLGEMERNLRALGLFAHVAVTAEDTAADGSVAVVVRAREAWTLRTLLSYARSSDGEQRWSALLEDGNFCGGGTSLTIGAGEDEDRTWRRAGWRSPRVRGGPWSLAVQATDQSDGFDLGLQVARPFRAQADPWSVELQLRRRDAEVRWYVSNASAVGEDPARPVSLYGELPSREQQARLTGLLRVAGREGGRLWRLGAGIEVSDPAYRAPQAGVLLSDGRLVDAAAFAEGAPTLARDAQPIVEPFVALQTLGRRWTTGRRLFQYGAVEDVPLDPGLLLRAGWSSRALGAEREAVLLELGALDWSRAPGGFWLLDARARAALGAAGQRGAVADLTAGWLGEARGLHARAFAEAALGERLGGREALVLGLLRGLRSLDYDGQAGDRLVRWTAELGRPLPAQLLGFWQLGLAAHYAAGAAWWRGETRGLRDARHEAGIGLRVGASRAGRADTARVDLTWDLAGGAPVVTAVTGGLF